MVIKNKKARRNFEFVDTYNAGIILQGTEIKSIREGKVSFTDSYCYFIKEELFLKNVHISEYEQGNINNHEPTRDRKLLLNKNELSKLKQKTTEKGLTIVPVKLFINEKNLAKVEIALARGKNLYDKRQDIKKRDLERNNPDLNL
jgi:SsrA-binding protein